MAGVRGVFGVDVEKVMEVEAFLSPTYAARLQHGQRNVLVAPPLPCLHAGSRFPCVCQQSRQVMA